MPQVERTFKLSDEPGDFGLRCDLGGLTLAGVSLLRRNGNYFEARPWIELREILSWAYAVDIHDESVGRGLDVVARALNNNDLGKAMTAAVLLRLPNLDWDGAARIANVERSLIKYRPDQSRDWRGRWTDEDNGHRLGIRPLTLPLGSGAENPSTAGADHSLLLPKDWVHLAPSPHRNDELADLAEWVVNAKPEDEAVLRQEINRYFFDPSNSDIPAGNEFHRALSDALDPGVGPADRKELLAELDPITRTDPATPWQIAAAALAVGGIFLGPATEGVAAGERVFGTGAEVAGEGAEIPAALSEGGVAAAEIGLGPLEIGGEVGGNAVTEIGELGLGETVATNVLINGVQAPAASIWNLGWGARGGVAEDTIGSNLSRTFPVIDKSLSGVITSIKSVDLSAAVYQNSGRLLWRINNYVDRVKAFDGATWGTDTVPGGDAILGRVLHLALPRGATVAQRAVLRAAVTRANSIGVNVSITIF